MSWQSIVIVILMIIYIIYAFRTMILIRWLDTDINLDESVRAEKIRKKIRNVSVYCFLTIFIVVVLFISESK
jgi:hypothetical protein